MPLLAFKYLPLKDAYIETVRIDWLNRQVELVALVSTEGRVGKSTLQFSDVQRLNITLNRSGDGSGIIESCKEDVGTFNIETQSGERVSVTASRYALV